MWNTFDVIYVTYVTISATSCHHFSFLQHLCFFPVQQGIPSPGTFTHSLQTGWFIKIDNQLMDGEPSPSLDEFTVISSLKEKHEGASQKWIVIRCILLQPLSPRTPNRICPWLLLFEIAPKTDAQYGQLRSLEPSFQMFRYVKCSAMCWITKILLAATSFTERCCAHPSETRLYLQVMGDNMK